MGSGRTDLSKNKTNRKKVMQGKTIQARKDDRKHHFVRLGNKKKLGNKRKRTKKLLLNRRSFVKEAGNERLCGS